MAIANVAITNTYDQWRIITNQVVDTLNLFTEGRMNTAGALVMTNPLLLNDNETLNVASGMIKGDGGLLSNLRSSALISNSIAFISNSSTLTVSGTGHLGTTIYFDVGTLSSNVNDQSIANIASANIVNIAHQTSVAAFSQANTANLRAIGAFIQANTSSLEAGGAHAKANTACTTADYAVVTVGAAYTKANTANSTADAATITVASAFNQANTANTRAIGAFAQANSASFPTGTRLIFAQDAAPTGWTKDTSNYNDHALRVVTGTGGGTGGSLGFTTAFASRGISGSVGSTTLAESQMPYHSHYMPGWSSTGMFGSPGSHGYGFVVDTSGAGAYPWYWLSFTGSGGAHNHSFTGTNLDMAVRYLNVITATKV
jgi:hypothetical protein